MTKRRFETNFYVMFFNACVNNQNIVECTRLSMVKTSCKSRREFHTRQPDHYG